MFSILARALGVTFSAVLALCFLIMLYITLSSFLSNGDYDKQYNYRDIAMIVFFSLVFLSNIFANYSIMILIEFFLVSASCLLAIAIFNYYPQETMILMSGNLNDSKEILILIYTIGLGLYDKGLMDILGSAKNAYFSYAMFTFPITIAFIFFYLARLCSSEVSNLKRKWQ